MTAAIDTFLAAPADPQTDYDKIGQAAGLPAGLYPKVVQVESAFKTRAVSSKGAVGPGQELPSTAAQPGYGLPRGDPKDPRTNAMYLKKMIDLAGGDVSKGLAMYNAGPHGHLDNPDTQAYVKKVGYTPPGEQPDSKVDAFLDNKDAFLDTGKSSLAASPKSLDAQVPGKQPTGLENRLRSALGAPPEGANPEYDKTLAADSPFADILPTVAGAKLMASLGSRMPGTLGRFLFNAPNTGHAVGQVLNAGEASADISRKMMMHDQASIARDVAWKVHYTGLLDEFPDYLKHDEEIYHFMEDPKGVKLSPQAQHFYDTQIKPVRTKNDRLAQELKANGVKMHGQEVDPKEYAHRQAMGQDAPPSWMDRAGDIVDPSGALRNTNYTKGFSRTADMMQQNLAGNVVSGATGEKAAYMIDPLTNEAKVWKNGKVITVGKVDPDTDTVVTKAGEKWNMTRGTTKDIEQHTPLKYAKSALSSVIETNRQLNDAVANVHFTRALKTNPDFLQYARPPGSATPPDWKTVSIPGYSGLDNWKMEPHMAEVIADYTKTAQGDPVKLLQGINRLVQGSIFINPLKHIFNVQAHGMVAAGLFGGTVRLLQGGVRTITPGERTLTMRAIDSVVNHDDQYLAYLKESPSLKGANVYVRNFGNDLLTSVGKNPQLFDPIARNLGYATGATFLKAAYSASNKTLWNVGDVLMMKAFLAREGEGTVSEVAKHVTQHMPDYQIPSRVLGSRSLSQILQSPAALGFSRYEYNRLASYGNMVKGLIKPSVGTRAQTMDQVAALVFHTAVTYPMMDYAIQKATGNPGASFQPFGPFVYPKAVEAYSKGTKTASQVGQTVARPSAAVETAKDIYYNQDNFGRPIYGHGGDFPKYLASKTFETQAIYNIVNPKKGVTRTQAAKQFLEDQVGIKDPTPQQLSTTQKYAQKELEKRRKDKP